VRWQPAITIPSGVNVARVFRCSRGARDPVSGGASFSPFRYRRDAGGHDEQIRPNHRPGSGARGTAGRYVSGILFDIARRSQDAFTARKANLFGDRSLYDYGIARLRRYRVSVRKRVSTTRRFSRGRAAFYRCDVYIRDRLDLVPTGDLCSYNEPSYRARRNLSETGQSH
jgi:hypothetical protein